MLAYIPILAKFLERLAITLKLFLFLAILSFSLPGVFPFFFVCFLFALSSSRRGRTHVMTNGRETNGD